MSTIAEVAAALANAGSTSGANVIAGIVARFTGGRWVIGQNNGLPGGLWQGPSRTDDRFNDYFFQADPSATAVQFATKRESSPSGKPDGALSAFNRGIAVLAFDGTHVLLGQNLQGPNSYGVYYLVSDNTLNFANPGFPRQSASPHPITYPYSGLVASGATYLPPPAACYAAGTRIRTERGDVRVEDLAKGDLVAVLSGDDIVMKPVIWIGHRRLDVSLHNEPMSVLPIRIKRGAFAEAVPSRDLLVSPDHAIYTGDVLIPAKLLVNGGSIVQDRSFQSIHYFHVELAEHGVIFAEGLAAESYLDSGNRGAFHNAAGAVSLHPDFRSSPAAGLAFCHRLAEDAATVQPVWNQLAQRATALGYALAQYDTLTDPALCVQAAGRTLRPVSAEGGRYVFVVPAGTDRVRLVSRSDIPGLAQPWLNDRRRLGVAVGRVVVRSETDTLDVALDSPDLAEGWWNVERAGSTSWRWTNGDARIALPTFAGNGILEISLAGETCYRVERPGVDPAARQAA